MPKPPRCAACSARPSPRKAIERLGLDEVLATCVLLLAAGHETTANLIANSTLALLNQPDQLPQLFGNPQRGTEELLRLEGAAKLAGRTALTEHLLPGHQRGPTPGHQRGLFHGHGH